MKITVINIVELSSGGAELHLEVDEEYKSNFKRQYGLKRWSKKKFEAFVIQAITNSLELEE